MPRSISRLVGGDLREGTSAVGLQVFDDPLVEIGDVLGPGGDRAWSRPGDVSHGDRVRPVWPSETLVPR
jgi:hypothetical protein